LVAECDGKATTVAVWLLRPHTVKYRERSQKFNAPKDIGRSHTQILRHQPNVTARWQWVCAGRIPDKGTHKCRIIGEMHSPKTHAILEHNSE
jgi:hypothetical protein